jgi:hypothetical protein
LFKPWDEYVSIDPCFVQAPTVGDPPTEGEAAALEAYQAKLKTAHDTGDWSAMLAPGRSLTEATKFTMLQVDRNVWRELLDRSTLPLTTPMRVGPAVLRALMLRLALKSISGCEVKVERSFDPKWGVEMAQPSIIDYLDSINPRIVGELGSRVMERTRGIDPL